MRNIKTYASCWCDHRGEFATGYPNGRAIEQGRNSPTECNRVQRSAMGKQVKPNTESQAGLVVARNGCVVMSAVRCRQSGVGFPPGTFNGEEGGDFHWIGVTLVSFRAGGAKADGSREAIVAWALAGGGQPGFAGWARSRGRAVAIRDQRKAHSGEVFGFEFGPWLDIATERVRSRSPCGVRTRDKYTKRTPASFSGKRCEERARQESGRLSGRIARSTSVCS